MTAKREGPRDEAAGTAGLCQSLAHSPEHGPPQWGPEAWEDEGAEQPFLEFDLGPPPELGPDIDCFFQELTSSTREDSKNDSSPEPPAEECERWVTWWGQVLDTPEWWQELVEIPEVVDHWELARKIQASFELPLQISKLHDMENYHLALLAPACLCWKDFLPLQDPKFPYHDIRMAQVEKTVAYVQALQFWAEKSNLPTLGQPCLLVRSILKLREVMEFYVSFPNDAILSSVALPEGFLEDQPETTISGSTQPASADSPIEEAAMEEATPVEEAAAEEASPIGRPQEEPNTSQTPSREPTRRESSPIWFPGWREVLHLSWPVTAARQAPLIPQESRWRPHSKSSWERRAHHQRTKEHLWIEGTKSESTLSTGLLETAWQVTPPTGFQEVMACLWSDPSLVAAQEALLEPLWLEAIMKPTVVMMCASHIMKDEAMGMTYMDTITTSMGQVALGAQAWGSKPRDHH